MNLLGILLSVGCVILILVLLQLMALKSELVGIRTYVEAFARHTDSVDEVRTEILDEIREIRGIQSEVTSDIAEIKYVTDVIYKYKLPNKETQAILDRVEIDNEIADRLMGADRDKSE